MKPTILLFFLLAICFDARAQALTQPFSYKPGYSVTLRQTMVSETLTSGEKQKQKTGNITEYKYHVTEILPNGDIKWATSISRYVLLNMAEKGAKSLYDSADPARDTSDKEVQLFDKMIGFPMYMTTTGKGQILAFSGAEALADTIVFVLRSRHADSPSQKTYKSSNADSSLFETMRNIWGILPKEPIKTGDTWKMQMALPALSDIAMENIYTLKTRNASQAVIALKSKALPRKMTSIGIRFKRRLYDPKAKGSGKIIVAQPDGMLLKASHIIKIKGVMHTNTATDLLPVNVPVTVKTIITTERL